jgi:hypothetical protein
LKGYALPNSGLGSVKLVETLRRGGVEIDQVEKFSVGGKVYPANSQVIKLEQPYSSFANAMLDTVIYPNLLDNEGKPIPPYDVTAHNLGMLFGAEPDRIMKEVRFNDLKKTDSVATSSGVSPAPCEDSLVFGTYDSPVPSMDKGWTNWILKTYKNSFLGTNVGICSKNVGVSSSRIAEIRNKAIIFPDQSPNQILNGYPKDRMPAEYVGGIGTEGVAKLQKFVEDGGTLVFMNRSSDFAIEQFKLPVVNIAKDWKRRDFFIPGSILRTELDTSHAITRGMKKESIAWFESSPVFDLKTGSNENKFARVIAKYPDDSKDILLSGWALGKEKIAGKAALVEVRMGRGKIILFGFRPQYRGQSLATLPLLFNAISY